MEEKKPQHNTLSKMMMDILRSDSFSAENFPRYPDPAKNLHELVDAIQWIHLNWRSSHLYNMQTLHAFLIYLISNITRTLETSKNSILNLNTISGLFKELNILITRYQRYYPDIQQDEHLPIAKLLVALCSHSRLASLKTAYSVGPEILGLLASWLKTITLTNTELATITQQLGYLAREGFFHNQQLKINFLTQPFFKHLKENHCSATEILSWLDGMSSLAVNRPLKHPIPVDQINLIVKQLAKSELNDYQATYFIKKLTTLLNCWAIENIPLLNYKSLENLLLNALGPTTNLNNIAEMAYHLRQLVDVLEPAEKISFTIIERFIFCLRDKFKDVEIDKNFSEQLRWAEAISTVLSSVAEITKTSPALYTPISLSEEFEQALNYLMESLALLQKHISKRPLFDTPDSKINTSHINYNKLMYASIIALRAYVLLGQSNPSALCKDLSASAGLYLRTFPEVFNRGMHSFLVNQYAYFTYLTRKPGEEYPAWLTELSNQYKPAPPKPGSFHAETVELLQKEGHLAKPPEAVYGPFPMDIVYYKDDFQVEICELNGGLWHTGGHHRGEPRDWFKAIAVYYIDGIHIRFIDLERMNYTPETLVAALLKSPSSPDLKTTSSPPKAESLAKLIAAKFPANNDLWRFLAVGKAVAGLAPPLPPDAKAESLPFELKEVKIKRRERDNKYHTRTSDTFNQLIKGAKEGNSSIVNDCLQHGHPINPYTGQKDGYTIVVALLCAMEQLHLTTATTLKACLRDVIKNLVERISRESEGLTKPRLNISPLILAVSLQPSYPEIYGQIVKKITPLSKTKNQRRKSGKVSKDSKAASDKLQTTLKEAREAAQKLGDIIPHIQPDLLLQAKEQTALLEPPVVPSSDPKTPFSPELNDLNDIVNDPFCTRADIPLERLEELAAKGYAFSQYLLGLHLFRGIKMQKPNLELAAHWFNEAAQQGNASAQFMLGIMNLRGFGPETHVDKAIHNLTLAAEQGFPAAFGPLAYIYQSIKSVRNLERAAEYYRKAAAHGRPLGQYGLGTMHEEGTFLEKDLKEARLNYELAATKDYPFAYLKLGILDYNAGKFQQALAHFLKSPKTLEALFYLAKIFADGEGVDKDPALAKIYFDQIAKKTSGNAPAHILYEIGRRMIQGDGFQPPDTQKGIAYLTPAADEGNADAQLFLGILYCDGVLAKKDLKKAVSYLELAVAQGNAKAQYRLGTLYITGADGIPPDYVKAENLLKLAATQGIAEAQFNLAMMYEKGQSIYLSEEQALDLYKQAALQGFEPAINKLRVIKWALEQAAHLDDPSLLQFTGMPRSLGTSKSSATHDSKTVKSVESVSEAKKNQLERDNSAAIQALKSEKFPKAIALFQQNLDFWSSIPDALEQQRSAAYNLGSCYWKAQQYKNAIPHLEMAIQLDKAILLAQGKDDDPQSKYRQRLKACKTAFKEKDEEVKLRPLSYTRSV